jgi:hypothetical protein
MINGWYYLHTNGDLIYKPDSESISADLRESDFVKVLWPVDTSDRKYAWQILVEALVMGARPERVKELADLWDCTDEDAQEYARRIGVVLVQDGDRWCAHCRVFTNLQEYPAGFGVTCLEALSDLARVLGLKPGKLWRADFKACIAQENKTRTKASRNV